MEAPSAHKQQDNNPTGMQHFHGDIFHLLIFFATFKSDMTIVPTLPENADKPGRILGLGLALMLAASTAF